MVRYKLLQRAKHIAIIRLQRQQRCWHAHSKFAPEYCSTSALHMLRRDRSVIALVILGHVAWQIEWTKDLTKVGLYRTASQLPTGAGFAEGAFVA